MTVIYTMLTNSKDMAAENTARQVLTKTVEYFGKFKKLNR